MPERSREDPRSQPLLSYRESATTSELVIRKPTPRYIDQFLDLRCATDLLSLRVFPNAKEITESLAAIRAVFIHSGLDRRNSRIHAVCVGDGSRPRTAATLAFRTSWTCHSVDPQLDVSQRDEWERSVRRLRVWPQPIEDLAVRLDDAPVVVVAVHAHVELSIAISSLQARGARVVCAVAIPCCGFVHDAPEMDAVAEYEDWGIWSEHRRVKVWRKGDSGDAESFSIGGAQQ